WWPLTQPPVADGPSHGRRLWNSLAMGSETVSRSGVSTSISVPWRGVTSTRGGPPGGNQVTSTWGGSVSHERTVALTAAGPATPSPPSTTPPSGRGRGGRPRAPPPPAPAPPDP